MSYSLIPSKLFSNLTNEPFNFPDIFNFERGIVPLLNERTGLELSEDNQNVYVKASLPGLNENEIDVTVSHNTLQIKGEKTEEVTKSNKRYYRKAQSSFWYQVSLPSQVEENPEPTTHYENGVLELTFKKSKPSQAKKIKIKTGTKKTK
jgi:HSP20 family protein